DGHRARRPLRPDGHAAGLARPRLVAVRAGAGAGSAGLWRRSRAEGLGSVGPGEGGRPMTSHDVTIAGYVVIAAGAVGLEVAARSHRFDVESLGTALSRVMRNRAGRRGVMAAWAWLGMPVFPRLSESVAETPA